MHGKLAIHVEQWKYSNLSPDAEHFPQGGEVEICVKLSGVKEQQMRTKHQIEIGGYVSARKPIM